VHIGLGDSKDLIKEVADSSVDLLLTDPPYNLAKYSTGNINLPWRKAINNDLAEWDLDEFNPGDWVDDFLRVLKPTGNLVIFTSYHQIGKWHEVLDDKFDTFQFAVWHKTNPVPKFQRAGFLNSCELIIFCWNKGHSWNFTKQNEMHNYFEYPICMGKERLKDPNHPTQKPVKLLKHIMKIASNEGDVVYDPFMGVGSTGAAAMELNREFIGTEIDEVFFNAAKKRLGVEDLDLGVVSDDEVVNLSVIPATDIV
jgi:site-specific DNA-methyltransferase (adenine-specific)/modification methylase